MASISSSPLNSTRFLISESFSELPELFFNSGVSEIATAVNAISDAIEIRTAQSATGSKETQEHEIVMQVLDAYDRLKTNPEFGAHFHPLSKLANNVGETLVNVFNILKTSVRPEVEALRSSIEGQIRDLLEKENLGHLVTRQDAPSENFTVLDWDKTLNMFGGTSTIGDTVGEFMGGYNISFSMNDLTTILTGSFLNKPEFSLNQMTLDDIVRRACEKAPAGFDPNSIKRVMQLITDSYAFNTLQADLLRAAQTTNDFGALLNRLLEELAALYPAYVIVRATPMDVTEAVLEDIMKNLDALYRVLITAAFVLLILRKHYANALVLNLTLINGDTAEQFDSDGGKFEDVAKYLFAFHITPNIPIPWTGIAASDILQKKEIANNEYTRVTQAQLMQATTIQQTYTARALKSVLTDYIQSADPSRLPEGMSIQRFYESKRGLVHSAAGRLNVSEDMHLDGVLYDFVLSLWYEGTMVKTAHELFGTEIVKQMEASSEMDTQTLALVDARVAAAICANFLVKEILVVK